MDFIKAISLMGSNDQSHFIDLDRDAIVRLDIVSTSKGNQGKYYDLENKLYIKEQFDYQGVLWHDYKVEHLSSILGDTLNTCISIAQQDIVTLSNGKYGCVSKDFAVGMRYVPIAKFKEYKELAKIRGKSFRVFSGILNIMTKCGILESDAREYLYVMIVLDYLLGNEDRHYNNIGMLYSEELGKFSICPLFDFGIGLLEHDIKYRGRSLQQCLLMMDGKPFDEDLFKPVQMIINIDSGRVKNICRGIIIPDRELFPNDLSYDYFNYAYKNLMEALQ